MKAPFGNSSRCVGNTCARTAGVRLGLNASCKAPLPVPVTSRSPAPADPKTVELELAPELPVGAPDAASLSLRRENAGPVSRRSNAISAGDFGIGCGVTPMGDGVPAKAGLGS
jgi:hypothetical protein